MSGPEAREVTVVCLLTIGDQAELVPDGWDGGGEPARWPVSAITGDTGLVAEAMTGRRFRARVSGPDAEPEFSSFRLLP